VGTHYRRKKQLGYGGYAIPKDSLYSSSEELGQPDLVLDYGNTASNYEEEEDIEELSELNKTLNRDYQQYEFADSSPILDISKTSRKSDSESSNNITPIAETRKRLSKTFQGGHHDLGMDKSKTFKLSEDEIELLAMSGIAKMDKGVEGRYSTLNSKAGVEKSKNPQRFYGTLHQEEGSLVSQYDSDITDENVLGLEASGKNILPHKQMKPKKKHPVIRQSMDESDVSIDLDESKDGSMAGFLRKSEKLTDTPKSNRKTLHTRAQLGDQRETGGDLSLNVEGTTPLTASVPKIVKSKSGGVHRMISPDSMPYVKAKHPKLPPPGQASVPGSPGGSPDLRIQFSSPPTTVKEKSESQQPKKLNVDPVVFPSAR